MEFCVFLVFVSFSKWSAKNKKARKIANFSKHNQKGEGCRPSLESLKIGPALAFIYSVVFALIRYQRRENQSRGQELIFH